MVGWALDSIVGSRVIPVSLTGLLQGMWAAFN